MYDFLFCQRNIQNKKTTKNLINFFARNFSWVSILFFIFWYIFLIFSVVVFCLILHCDISLFISFLYWAYEFIISIILFWVSFSFGLLSFIILLALLTLWFRSRKHWFTLRIWAMPAYFLKDHQIMFRNVRERK